MTAATLLKVTFVLSTSGAIAPMHSTLGRMVADGDRISGISTQSANQTQQ